MSLDVSLFFEKRTGEGWRVVEETWCRGRTLWPFLMLDEHDDPEDPPPFGGVTMGLPPDADLSVRHRAWSVLCAHGGPPHWDVEDFRSEPSWPSCSCLDGAGRVSLRDLMAYDWAQTVYDDEEGTDVPLWDVMEPDFLTALLEMARVADGDLGSVRMLFYFY